MLLESEKTKLKELFNNYSVLRGELLKLKTDLELITSRQQQVHQELENTRNEEKSLINNIENKLNRKLSHEDLIQIITS